MNTRDICTYLTNWLKDKVTSAGANGVVLGVSGGIDSAVVAGIASKAFPKDTLGLILPCHSHPQDMAHAKLVIDRFQIECKEIILDKVYDQFVMAMGATYKDPRSLSMANIKPRLRMITLYHHAADRNYLVLGTGNKSELTVGYFTKYGDSGVDLLPIGSLVKSQVVDLAKHLDVPTEIIEKPPTAGLWEGQTDEKEMEITYNQLDNFILTGNGPIEIVERINKLNKNSQHKRELPPMANPNF
jgi:NAD+ synthase